MFFGVNAKLLSPGGLRSGCDDGDFLAEDGVHQRRFADVGAAHYRDIAGTVIVRPATIKQAVQNSHTAARPPVTRSGEDNPARAAVLPPNPPERTVVVKGT